MGRHAGLPVVYLPVGREVWMCRFTVAGKRFHLSTGERDQGRAREAAQRLYHQTATAAGQAPRRRRLERVAPLADLSGEYLATVEAERSRWTLKMQTVHWTHFLRRWKALDDLSATAIERYKVDRLRDATATTVYKELVTLHRFFRWCKRNKLLDTIPEFERPRPASDYKPPDLTPDDVRRLLAAMPDATTHHNRYPVREWYTVMWAQALRTGELRSLRWADVDLAAGRITIRPARDKARVGRTIALAPEAADVLRRLRPEHPLPTAPVFGDRDFKESIKRASIAAKLPNVTPHHLRHARLSELASVSRDVAAVQFFAGHQSLTTTDRYVRSRTERTEELLRAVDSGRSAKIPAARPKAKKR
jgi:integrase/recombinase XerC